MTTRSDILDWLVNRPHGATHMLVVCDTYDHADYPVYIVPEGDGSYRKEVSKALAELNGPDMQRVIEVYSFSRNLMNQLNEIRAWHPD